METYCYISMIALFCYAFMLLTFLAAKKDKLVNSFLIVLVALIFWTGGSVFMRLELWPDYKFWFQVSLCGILLLPYAYYRFINVFSGIREQWVGKVYIVVMMACFLVNWKYGWLLAPPALVKHGGDITFVYDMDLKAAGFFLVAAALLAHMFRNLVKVCRSNKNMRRQYEPLIVGIVLLFAGNLAIAIPFFEGFPIDLLCGLLNALALLFALIRRRLFRLQMLASEGLCYGVGLMFCLIFFANLSPYLQRFVQRYIPPAEGHYVMIFAVLFLLAYLLFTFVWRLLMSNVFIKEELLQAEQLKRFGRTVSKTLRLQDIMEATIQVIKDTIQTESIYICIQNGPGMAYQGRYSDRPLSDLSFALEEENPIVQWLKKNDDPLLYREFRYSVEYKSMWESEKHELEKMGLHCCVALKDDNQLVGILLLCDHTGKRQLGYSDLQILSSITSVASIAVKNARMYEQACLEARTDELTGLLNRKYFYEILNQEFEKNIDGSLVLAIFNVDDFKLYNQLYGMKEGDYCLKRIAGIIRGSVGEQGYVARYSGKEFAVLLPGYDVLSARTLMESIQKQIYEMNSHEQNFKLKAITVSVGISAAPYAAKSVKELLNNVDMAVYHVKQSGKNGLRVFDTVFQQNLELEDTRKHVHIYKEYESTIYALTAAIDAKDHYTFSHSNNVAYYAVELARYLGMNEDVVEIIRQSGLLHDVGKIGIRETILNKEGALTNEEYEIIKGHVEASIDIIRHLPSLDYVIPAVIGHHERYDGKGYPRRIAGEDIPATARILCIADSFDAMTSKRCYKRAFSVEKAKRILQEEAGKQFDPAMAAAFIKCLDEGRIKLVNGEFSGENGNV